MNEGKALLMRAMGDSTKELTESELLSMVEKDAVEELGDHQPVKDMPENQQAIADYLVREFDQFVCPQCNAVLQVPVNILKFQCSFLT